MLASGCMRHPGILFGKKPILGCDINLAYNSISCRGRGVGGYEGMYKGTGLRYEGPTVRMVKNKQVTIAPSFISS